MIDKLFDGVIEQVYNQTGVSENNIVMACYNNDFSMDQEGLKERYSKGENDVFFACHEFAYNKINGAYAPFLNVIYDMFEKYIGGEINDFLEKCEVYYLHREIYRSYFEEGICKRVEPALFGEIEYEKERMASDVAKMLRAVAQIHPVVIVINRFHLASRSSVGTIIKLLKEPSKNIGIVLGSNENRTRLNADTNIWNNMLEIFVDENKLYHLGYTRLVSDTSEKFEVKTEIDKLEKFYNGMINSIKFLDMQYALNQFKNFDRMIEEKEIVIDNNWRVKINILYCEAAMLSGNFSKALDIIDDIAHIKLEDETYQAELDYICSIFIASCYMYQGKLEDAQMIAKLAKKEAEKIGDEKKIFESNLIIAMVKMSGWNNIFFCVNDIEIDDSLIEKLLKYEYKNHLAHVYIYAYDNRPEVVAKAYRSEALLVHFSKGVELAKEIDNVKLIIEAFHKNTMIAATNGMNEIAILYTVRVCEYLRENDEVELAMTYLSLGYNLSALGHNELADDYYNRGIEVLCKYDCAKEIAEANYNKAMNFIMLRKYKDAQICLEMAMKTIERLHMNSLRVCNLSKLYALLALVAILQKKTFDCERNLINCKQFLNYSLSKEKNDEFDVVMHDYSMCDDDMFLYTLATALWHVLNSEDQMAYEAFSEAEKYLAKSEGNQFYVYDIYRESRADLFKKIGKTELYEKEVAFANEHKAVAKSIKETTSLKELDRIKIDNIHEPCSISLAAQDRMSKHVAVEKDYQNSKKQMEFLGAWQNLIDNASTNIDLLVDEAVRYFLNYFNNDKALYIRYKENEAEVLFNNTYISITDEMLEDIRVNIKRTSEGFAVSKISDNFFEHLDLVSYFGIDEVCSFVAIPFISNGKVQAVFITYVLMKENWHNSINRYMLNDDDLSIYKLLFRELFNAINRLDANKQIRKMNIQLAQNAITDMLTGLYNRAGLYKGVRDMKDDVAILFLDLDNFKPYNDTYGHDAGDIVLIGMAKILKEVVDRKGFVCRYGGDEFIIVAHTTDRTEIEAMVKKIYERIEQADGFVEELQRKLHRDISIDTNKKLTVSIGIALRNENDSSIDDTIKRADDLMYTVKINGKGTYAFI